MRILQTRPFKQAVKRLHADQKEEVDDAVRLIAENPELGEAKVGDLTGVRVYKFRIGGQLALLAYNHNSAGNEIVFLVLRHYQYNHRDIFFEITLALIDRKCYDLWQFQPTCRLLVQRGALIDSECLYSPDRSCFFAWNYLGTD